MTEKPSRDRRPFRQPAPNCLQLFPLATIFLAIVLVAAPASANPFVQPKGEGIVTFTAAYWSFDEFLNGNGDTQEVVDIEQTSFILGLEHGISERVTLTASLPWASSERDAQVAGVSEPLLKNEGASDAKLGLKWRLSGDGPTKFSLLVGAKWAGEYEPDVVNSPGDGNFDSELLFSLGRQAGRVTYSIDAGYRARSGNPADEIVARGEFSLLVGTRVFLFSAVDWVDSEEGLQITPSTGVFFPYSRTEEDLTRVTLGVLGSFSEKWSGFLAASRTVDGVNTPLGTQYAVGFSISF